VLVAIGLKDIHSPYNIDGHNQPKKENCFKGPVSLKILGKHPFEVSFRLVLYGSDNEL